MIKIYLLQGLLQNVIMIEIIITAIIVIIMIILGKQQSLWSVLKRRVTSERDGRQVQDSSAFVVQPFAPLAFVNLLFAPHSKTSKPSSMATFDDDDICIMMKCLFVCM